MSNADDRNELEVSLTVMESEALNFAYRFINDGNVRISYINQTKMLAQEYRKKVTSGAMPPKEAALQVYELRNQIMEAQRLRTSDIGRAKAVNLKHTGLDLSELTEKYAQRKFDTSFLKLSPAHQNQVYLEIIESSGRARPSVNTAANRLSNLGKGLLVVTVGIAIYNITSADNKKKAIAREGAVISGGFVGGAAGGALAGLACGPGAPVCSVMGVFIGGALGAMGADFTFGWVF